MVRLRLSVKVFPHEQAAQPPPSSSLSLRSFFGEPKDDVSGGRSSGSTAGAAKPVNFLLVVDEPEKITMGGLAWEIQEKWKKLRPDVEPLNIKKLLDDDHDSDDVDVEMTVADVFMDRGKGRKDGFDQRATVRVIQKPSSYAPTRFPSVVQDWDAAAQDFQRKKTSRKLKHARTAEHNIPTIVEEPSSEGSPDVGLLRWSPSPPSHSQNDDHDHPQEVLPVSSVEDQEAAVVHTQGQQGASRSSAGTPPRMGSIELGSSTPLPSFRKPEPSSPKGIAREPAQDPKSKSDTNRSPSVDIGNSANEANAAKENGTDAQSRKRKPTPDSQTANKEPRLEKENDTSPKTSKGIGLGITASPSKRRSMPSMNSDAQQQSQRQQQSSFSSSASVDHHSSTKEEAKLLHAALHKGDSPRLNGQRSVSFAVPGNGGADATVPPKKVRTGKPPNARQRGEMEKMECERLGKRIQDLEKEQHPNTEYIARLREVHEMWAKVIKYQLSKKGGSSQIARELRPQLDVLWKKLEEYEDSMTTAPSLQTRDDTTIMENDIDDETPFSKRTSIQNEPASARKTSSSVNGSRGHVEKKRPGKIRSPTPASVIPQVGPASTEEARAASPSASSDGDLYDASPVLRPEEAAGSKNRKVTDGEQEDDLMDLPDLKLGVSDEEHPASEGGSATGDESNESNESSDDDDDDDDDDDKDHVPRGYVSENQEPEVSKADLLKRVNMPTSSPATKSSPFQPPPQWQAVNTRPTLKSMRVNQSAEQMERAAATPKPEKRQETDKFLSFGLESDNEDGRSSESSDNDQGDIMFSGTSSKLRKATKRR